jgi:hypothetical protein
MSEKLISHTTSFRVKYETFDKRQIERNFDVYSDAERYALEKAQKLSNKIIIEQIDTKIFSTEQVLREINPLAPKPDIVILEDWTIHPNEKGPYLSGLATNHPKWPTIPQKGMSTGHIIGKKGDLIVTETGTKYDLQTKDIFEETSKETLLACLAKI